jgi:hypothetical protein
MEKSRRGVTPGVEGGMPVPVELVGAILDATVVRAGLVPAHLEEMTYELEVASHRESPSASPPS